PDVGYTVLATVLPEESHQGISQQAAAKKAIREASNLRRPHRRFPNGNSSSGSFSKNDSNQQFFRPGPPSSQQGGSGNIATSNFNSNKKNTNPFRQ
ncbi:hypothetical protein PS6_011740, partial [Mucor atramentarius]